MGAMMTRIGVAGWSALLAALGAAVACGQVAASSRADAQGARAGSAATAEGAADSDGSAADGGHAGQGRAANPTLGGASHDGGASSDGGVLASGGTAGFQTGTGGAAGGDPSGGAAAGGAEFRDTDGDGVPDPLTASDFGDGALPVTDAEVEETRLSACTGWAAEAGAGRTSLMIVVDASASMYGTAPGTGAQSKWEITRAALATLVMSLPATTSVGLLAYPNQIVDGVPGGHDSCVNVDAMLPPTSLGDVNARPRLLDALAAVDTAACTPTHDAYVVAVEATLASNPDRDRYVLLLTDGPPTLTLGCEPGACAAGVGYETPVIDEIENTRLAFDIPTFVVGIPGEVSAEEPGAPDDRWWLSQAAEVGGTSRGDCSHTAAPYCHLDTTTTSDFPGALAAALATVAEVLASCEYSMPPPPAGEQIDLSALNVYVWPDGADPLLLLRSSTAACDQGWFLDEASARVVLCPKTCALLRSDPKARVEVLFGCASQPVTR